MLQTVDYYVDLDVPLICSDYAIFADISATVKLSETSDYVQEIHFKNLTILNCDGHDVFRGGLEVTDGRTNSSGFYYDVARHLIIDCLSDSLVSLARYEANYNTANGSRSPYGK